MIDCYEWFLLCCFTLAGVYVCVCVRLFVSCWGFLKKNLCCLLFVVYALFLCFRVFSYVGSLLVFVFVLLSSFICCFCALWVSHMLVISCFFFWSFIVLFSCFMGFSYVGFKLFFWRFVVLLSSFICCSYSSGFPHMLYFFFRF